MGEDEFDDENRQFASQLRSVSRSMKILSAQIRMRGGLGKTELGQQFLHYGRQMSNLSEILLDWADQFDPE